MILRPTYKQHLVYEALKDKSKDTIFFGGGAGGGKSWLICESRLVNAIRFPGYRSFIGREELKRLMQSTFVTFAKVCAYHKIPTDFWKLNGQYNYIEFKNGSRIDLLDLKFLPTDPMYERLGSLEYTDGAIEEAGEVEFMAFDVLKSRVGRHMNKEFDLHPTILITGNPKKNWTYQTFYRPWKEGKLASNTTFVQALYSDNEHTSETYGKQLSLISDKSTIERLKYGNWEYENDPNTLMRYDSIQDMWTNPSPENQLKYISADIARFGSDRSVVTLWNGLEMTEVHTFTKKGTDETSQAIRDLAFQNRVPYSRIIVDADGIGGGVIDQLKGVKSFISNASPFEVETISALGFKGKEKPNFANLKAQCSYKLAELVNNRGMSIKLVKCIGETEIKVKELIIEDLEQIKSKDLDDDKKLKVMPKDEVREHIGRSPDYGDCLMMRMYFEVSGTNYESTQATVFYPGSKPRIGSDISGIPGNLGRKEKGIASVYYQKL